MHPCVFESHKTTFTFTKLTNQDHPSNNVKSNRTMKASPLKTEEDRAGGELDGPNSTCPSTST